MTGQATGRGLGRLSLARTFVAVLLAFLFVLVAIVALLTCPTGNTRRSRRGPCSMRTGPPRRCSM